MKRAFSLIEIILALAVMGMSITGIAGALYHLPLTTQSLFLENGALTRARNLLSQGLESGTAVSSSTQNGYESARYITEREDESISSIRALVSWNTAFGSKTHLALEARTVNPGNPPAICDSFVGAGWKEPAVRKTYALRKGQFGGGELADSVRIRAFASNPYQLIVAADSIALASSPTLLFFDANGMSADLSLTASFDNASTSRIGYGAVAANNSYTYGGNAFGSKSSATCSDEVSCAQVHVFESNGNRISRIAVVSFATTTPPFAKTLGGETAGVTALFYYKNYLYVGLEKTHGGSEFNIVDVRDPARPQWVSGYSIGRSVNHILVRGPYAYISSDTPSRELIILDITTPTTPILIGEYDAPGASNFGYSSASLVRNTHIRLGRTYSSNASELLLLNAMDLTSIQVLHEENVGTVKDPQSVKAMASMDTLTFVLLTRRLQFWDTSTETSLLKFTDAYELPESSIGAALACRSGLLYVGRNTGSGIGAIDILSGS